MESQYADPGYAKGLWTFWQFASGYEELMNMLTIEVLKSVESFNTQNTLAQAECWLPDTLCWIGKSKRNTLGTMGAHEGGLQVRVETSSKRYSYMWVLMGLEV